MKLKKVGAEALKKPGRGMNNDEDDGDDEDGEVRSISVYYLLAGC